MLCLGRKLKLYWQAVRRTDEYNNTKGGVMTTNPKKCANPVCTCIPADKSKYCSAHCEGTAGKTTIVICRCGHADCGGNAMGS